MLPGQMSLWQLESLQDNPRNISLKFGQNRVSNSWDITDRGWADQVCSNVYQCLLSKVGKMNKDHQDKCSQDICCSDKCHHDKEAIKTKNSQIVEKVHNFDDPTSTEIWKNWNVDYFDIVAPPLTIAKTVPKSYQTDTWGLFYSYIGHICTKCCIYLTNISPIYHKNQGHISVIWIWGKCEKFRPTPSSQS